MATDVKHLFMFLLVICMPSSVSGMSLDIFFFFNLNCFVVVLLCFHVELLRVLYIFQILV